MTWKTESQKKTITEKAFKISKAFKLKNTVLHYCCKMYSALVF